MKSNTMQSPVKGPPGPQISEAGNVMEAANANIERMARSCPVCGINDSAYLDKLSRQGWDTVKCSECSMVYLSEAPRYESLVEDLAWSKQFGKEEKRRKKEQPLISWLDEKTRWRLHIARVNEWEYISRKCPSNGISVGRILDVGCGSDCKIPEPFTPYGVEIDKKAVEVSDLLMRARGGHVVCAPAIDGISEFDDDFFDGIIMRSYLEHEADPRAVLKTSYKKLKPGGSIYVKVPNFGTLNRMVLGVNWCGFRFPDHLNYFDIKSLCHLASLENFSFELINKLSRLTNDNMHCFLTRQ